MEVVREIMMNKKIDTKIARKVRPRTEREKAAAGKQPPIKIPIHPMIKSVKAQ